MDMLSTRAGFGKALAELGEKYDFYVCDADLAEATKSGAFPAPEHTFAISDEVMQEITENE